jgi:hypothetical protein
MPSPLTGPLWPKFELVTPAGCPSCWPISLDRWTCWSPPRPMRARPGVIDKPAWRAGQPLCPKDTLNYSRDPANLGRARGAGWRQGIEQVLAGCGQLLRPGGLLVTVTKNTRRAGRLNDLATLTIQLADHAGLVYLQHLIALHAAVRDAGLVARPSFWQLTQTRRARARGEPAHLVVHEDVLVFARPTMVAAGG